MNKLKAYYYEFRYRILKWYWMCSSRRSKIKGVVLMYHHISEKHLDELDNCQHTLEQFRYSITSLLRLGYTFVSIETALRLIKERSSLKFAVVTFDDVPVNAYENAVPYLILMQIPFAFFITTGFLGKEGFLSENQLQNLDKLNLCTIGAHTVSHPVLRNVSNSFEELYESKQHLEKILGHPIDYFAYPYGRQSSVSHKVIKQVKHIGFKCAFGTIDAEINDISSKNIYYLPRIVRK